MRIDNAETKVDSGMSVLEPLAFVVLDVFVSGVDTGVGEGEETGVVKPEGVDVVSPGRGPVSVGADDELSTVLDELELFNPSVEFGNPPDALGVPASPLILDASI